MRFCGCFLCVDSRCKIRDVHYMKISSYLENSGSNDQIEFTNRVSNSGKLLRSKYQRTVFVEKESWAVVVFFPPNLQNNINLLLEIEQKI